MSSIDDLLDKKVSDLVKKPTVLLEEEEKERYRIYSHLLFSITHHYFAFRKYQKGIEFPRSPSIDELERAFEKGHYYGHNIAAIAVNGDGEVIAFEFNHNKTFNSSVEHAESRLTRRVFSLSQVHHSWNETDIESKKYSTILEDITVFTTLESCTQCTGIMTLGNVKQVIYLQEDPGMYHIGNIVRNITEKQHSLKAPLPISGADIDFKQFSEINAAFSNFKNEMEAQIAPPFCKFEYEEPYYSTSITSFLCTKPAFDIFKKSKDALSNMHLSFPDYKPLESAKTNSQALEEARDFYLYCIDKGFRGTPHRM